MKKKYNNMQNMKKKYNNMRNKKKKYNNMQNMKKKYNNGNENNKNGHNNNENKRITTKTCKKYGEIQQQQREQLVTPHSLLGIFNSQL
jgi:hypothetical protein